MLIENRVNTLINDIVLDRHDLNIKHLSYYFGIHIFPNEHKNFYMHYDGMNVIALKYDKPHKMFESFCHELAHMELHHTNQYTMPEMYNRKEEAEAYKFAMCMMMPEKLIYRHELYTAQDIMGYFNVTEALALERIEMLINSSKRKWN